VAALIPLRDRNPRRSWPLVTLGIALVNVVVFAYQASLEGRPAAALYVLEHGFVPARFAVDPAGAVVTLLTYAFLHGSLLHLLGNMVFLAVFADNVEDRLGRWRFLAFYLLGGAVAGAAQGLLGGEPKVPLIGASGAIGACLGAYIRLFPRQSVQALIPVLIGPWLVVRLFSRQRPWFAPWLPAWLFLGYWALVQASEVLGSNFGEADGVAWWAHVGGFAFGTLAVKAFARRDGRANEFYTG